MKKTFDVYLAGDDNTAEQLCDSCKFEDLNENEEPCKSCHISGWQQKEKEDDE